MAKKPILNDITISFADVTQLNQNWDKIETSFENTLSRDGSTPNTMLADIDLNSNDLLNVNELNATSIKLGGVLLTADANTIPAGSITSTELGANAVTSAKIADGAVSAAKLADADFGDFTVSSGVATLDSGVVNTAELAAGAVTADKLGDIRLTRTQIVSTSIDSSVNEIRTSGYNAVGDGGGALYKRVGTEPSHAFKVQSADGAWWEGVPIGGVLVFEQFGAAGDGTTDDTAALSNCLSAAKSSLGVFAVTGTGSNIYLINTTLDPDGVSIVASGRSADWTIKTADNTGIAILYEGDKGFECSGFSIDMSAQTGDCCGILLNGAWRYKIDGLKIIGPGKIEPTGANQRSYGIVGRSLYGANAYTSHTMFAELDALRDAASISTFGVYYGEIKGCRIETCGIGIGMASREENSSPTSRNNQNSYLANSIVNCWHNVWMQGCGGGHVFLDTSAEAAGGASVTVEDQATGGGPVWIGGEITSDTSTEFVGPGLIINVSGETTPAANTAGEIGTHLRFSGTTPQVFGQGFRHDLIIAPDFSGTETIAGGGSANVITTRADFGSNAVFRCVAKAQGNTRYESVILVSAGSSGALALGTPDNIGINITWSTNGTDTLTINNSGGSPETVEWTVQNIGLL